MMMTTMTPPGAPPSFRRDTRGFTGAEKALLICFGLAIIALVGFLVSGGGRKAGGDAERTLAAGRGALGQGTSLGQMFQPGELPQAGQIQAPGAVAAAPSALQQAAEPPPPAAAPPPPPRPTPLPNGLDDRQYDGALIGEGGRAYPPGTPLSQVPPFVPSDGRQPNGQIVYVNGILTDKDAQAASLQHIADVTGSSVIGIHNATGGVVRDLAQSAGDKTHLSNNPAIRQLSDTVYDAVSNGRPIHLFAHSQGAIITSAALRDVRNRLMIEDGMTRAQAEAAMGRITVETFGGAATTYPDGPSYTHYINRWDGVAASVGLGTTRLGNVGAGRGARVIRFNEFHWNPAASHSFDDLYLPRRGR